MTQDAKELIKAYMNAVETHTELVRNAVEDNKAEEVHRLLKMMESLIRRSEQRISDFI